MIGKEGDKLPEGVPAGAMFIGLSALRNGAINRRWTRSIVFITLHSAAFTYVAQEMKNVVPGDDLLTIKMFATLGVVFGILWILLNQLTERWVGFYSDSLGELETVGDGAPIQVFSSSLFVQLERLPGFRLTLMGFAWTAFFGWMSFATYLFILQP